MKRLISSAFFLFERDELIYFNYISIDNIDSTNDVWKEGWGWSGRELGMTKTMCHYKAT